MPGKVPLFSLADNMSNTNKTVTGHMELVDGCKLYYELSGPPDGPVLVFSETLFWDVGLFKHQVAAFSAKGYRCVCYDHRGQNRSSPSDTVISVEQAYQDVIALIEGLGLSPLVFIGNSYGGFLAFRLACRRPDLVKGVVALGSSADAQASEIPQVSPEDFQKLVDDIAEVGPENPDLREQILYIMFGETFLSDPSYIKELDHWKHHLQHMGRGVAKLAGGAVVRESMLPELAACETPILFVHGDQDHAFPPAMSTQAFEILPEKLEPKQLVFVPECGHSVAVEAPDILNAHLAEFLSQVDH